MSANILNQSKPALLVVLGAITLLSCYVMLPQYLRANESAFWPQTQGVITTSHLATGYFKGMKGYYGVIEYDYSVGATRFHGTRLSFNRVHLAVQSAWQPVVDSYPVGKQIIVYYDPQTPSFAVLEPGLHHEMHDMFILAIALITLSAATFLWVLLAT
jgi:hypothetical protein